MKLITIFLFIVQCAIHPLFGQTFFSKDIGKDAEAEGVTVSPCTGGYYITGNKRDRSRSDTDAYLVRVDNAGKVLWEKTYGGTKDDFGWGMCVLRNGDVIITGFSDSQGNGKDDVLVIRTDADGNQKWMKTFGGPYDDRSWSVIETSDNAIVIAGEYAVADNKTNLDGWLLKLDGDGKEVWSNKFGADRLDRCFSVVEATDNGFILSGFTNSSGAGDYDVYLVKTDASGHEQWHKTFGGAGFDVGHTVRLMGTTGYMVVGYSRSFKPNGKGDAYMIQTDLKGNKLREKNFGDDGEERTLTFTESATGGYVLLGYKEITNDNWDAYLVEVSKDLTPGRSKKLGGPYLDTGGHNLLRVGQDYVFTGYINATGRKKNVYVTRTNFESN